MKQLTFTALGGLEEIGLNCYLYGISNNKSTNYLMVDLGLGFKDYKFKFLDNFIPDISLIKQKNNQLEALLITHGHEDHIGAIEYHFSDLKNIPIYTTPLTADLIRNKLKTRSKDANIIEVELGKQYQIGEFQVMFLPIEHSIPSATMVAINTEYGSLVHSGDFKVITDTFDANYIKEKLTFKPKYLFCDSTNSIKETKSEDESVIIPTLNEIIQNSKQAVWVTLFASNIERLANIIKIAKDNDRKVVLLGASVKNYYNVGVNHNYIKVHNIISEEDAKDIAGDKLLYIITGSQGEERSFLHNMLFQGSKLVKIRKGDTMIFSSKVIPGNEVNVGKIHNALAELEVNLFTSNKYKIHVSGHPSIEELTLLYAAVNPEYIIPMHGERLHIKYQQKLAKKLNYKSVTFKNGEVVNLSAEVPSIVDKVQFGKLHYESGRNISIDSDMFKERKKVMFEGLVNTSILIKNAKINEIKFNILGLLLEEEKKIYTKQLVKDITKRINNLSAKELKKLDLVELEVKKIIRKFFINTLQKKPPININIFNI
ncbi:ribonuclease J [Rickettsiales bacterium LUAb2]